jgi:hypothetical protein
MLEPTELKFEFIATDGGQYSPSYKCDNMLKGDTRVYCSMKKDNVNILLRYNSDIPFVLTHIIVKAPEFG